MVKGKIVFVSSNPKRGILAVKQTIDGLVFENAGWIESVKRLTIGDEITLPKGAHLDKSQDFAKWAMGAIENNTSQQG